MAPRSRRPRPKISFWARFRHWLRYWRSPLQLRSTYQRLTHNGHPLYRLVCMFIPYPSWYFPIEYRLPLRPLIEDTQNKTGIISSHFRDIHNLRAIPIWRMRDTPLRSIYRLYELHLSDHYTRIGWETEYFFFRPDWKLENIPDPEDPDPLRYAIIASITEELHDAVNWRLSLGLRRNEEHIYREEESDPWPPFTPERLPPWTTHVAPCDRGQLKQTVPPASLDKDGNLVLEQGGKALNFTKRNIITNSGWFYTI